MSHQITARQLRKSATWAEKELWRVLRSRRLSGYKFRRQHPQGPYFLDFYCVEAKVAVESDGLQHGFPEHQEHDQKRLAYLAAQGIAVKRMWNSQLARDSEKDAFVENLWRLLQERAPHPRNVALPRHSRDQSRRPSP